MVRTLMISYRDELLSLLGLTQEQFEEEARLMVAGKLYESGRLTAGQSAELIGMGKVEFLMKLHRVGISASNLDVEDIESDIEFGLRG